MMTKGLFIHRPDSIYNDKPNEYYQFPKSYLSRASQFVGDWVVYYEPTKLKNTRGYFAIAKLDRITPDPTNPERYLALLEPQSYAEFDNCVPYKNTDGVVEKGVLNEEGNNSGRAQSSVRPISDEDFNRIFDLGFPDELILPREEHPIEGEESFSRSNAQTDLNVSQGRDRISYITSRKVRSRVFRKNVLEAYDSRCALSGLKFVNGGGRAEVEAAHIKPVEHDGPDMVVNGIALSGTVHWMFDRGLISLTDSLEILVSRQANDTEGIWNLLNKSKRARAPSQNSNSPHPQFLRWHRENCFKS